MLRFDIDINPVIDSKECHVMGYFELVNSCEAVVYMTYPFEGESEVITGTTDSPLNVDSSLSRVENILTKLYIAHQKKAVYLNNVSRIYGSLGKYEEYDATKLKIAAFAKTTDVVPGTNLRLTNMAKGYSFVFCDREWHDSEMLYLCGEFSNKTPMHGSIQETIFKQTCGYASKRFIKNKYKKFIRKDFDSIRIQWMLFVVWQKCMGNEEFRNQLAAIDSDVVLMEDTTAERCETRGVWGCLNDEGVFKGENNLGKILMLCRDSLKAGMEPPIDYQLLQSKNIYLFGKELKFY